MCLSMPVFYFEQRQVIAYYVKMFKIWARRWQIKINIRLSLVLIKILYYLHNSVCRCSQLDVNNNSCFSSSFLCLYALHKRYQLLYNCSTVLCILDVQTIIILFIHTVSPHKSNWSFLDPIACFVLQRIQSDECSWKSMLEASPFRDLCKFKYCYVFTLLKALKIWVRRLQIK